MVCVVVLRCRHWCPALSGALLEGMQTKEQQDPKPVLRLCSGWLQISLPSATTRAISSLASLWPPQTD